MKKELNIAMCQLPVFLGDRKALEKDLLTRDEALSKDGCNLVVYPWSYFGMAFAPDEATTRTGHVFLQMWLNKLAKKLKTPTILPFSVLGAFDPLMDVAYINEGKVDYLLTSYTDAKTTFDLPPQDAYGLFALDDVQFGVVVDLFGFEPFNTGAESVDVILELPVCGMDLNQGNLGGVYDYVYGDLPGLIEDINAYIVCVNSVGLIQEAYYSGGSFVLTPEQKLLHVAPLNEPQIVMVDIFAEPEETDWQLLELPSQEEQSIPNPYIQGAMQQIVESENADGVAILLTDSFASLLLATLACDALGKNKVKVWVLPGMSSSQKKEMQTFLERLDLKPETFSAPEKKVLSEQSQPAFVAGAMVASFAHAHNYLYVSAQDKTALCLGVDVDNMGAADYAPLSVFLSTDFFKMATERNDLSFVFSDECLTEFALNNNYSIWPKVEELYKQYIEGTEYENQNSSLHHVVDTVLEAIVLHGVSPERFAEELPELRPFLDFVLEEFNKHRLMLRRLPFFTRFMTSNVPLSSFPLFSSWDKHMVKKDVKKDLDFVRSEVAINTKKYFEKCFLEDFGPSEPEEENPALSEFRKKFVETLEEYRSLHRPNDYLDDGLMSDN